MSEQMSDSSFSTLDRYDLISPCLSSSAPPPTFPSAPPQRAPTTHAAPASGVCSRTCLLLLDGRDDLPAAANPPNSGADKAAVRNCRQAEAGRAQGVWGGGSSEGLEKQASYLARLAPTTFLYATERRLRSSTVRSSPIFAIARVAFTIS
eukprot:3704945-Rhodomonas_salina.1